MRDPKIVIPFDVTSAQVLTLDTTPVTIASFTDSDSPLVRVPVRLELSKAAGTAAYTVTYNHPGQNLFDDTAGSVYRRSSSDAEGQRGELFTRQSDAYINGLTADSLDEPEAAQNGRAFLLVRDDHKRVLFRIPTAILKSASATGSVIFPSLSGFAFRAGRNTFTLVSNVALAAGDSAIRGRIFFEEFPVNY